MTAKVISLADGLGVITIDDNGNIQSANGFACKIFGYSQENLLTMNIAGCMPRPCACADQTSEAPPSVVLQFYRASVQCV